MPDPTASSRSDADSFLGHTVLVSAFTLLSRIFGLARDLILARILGDTPLGSVFAAAFAIPNLFRRLFGEGALSASFIPEYAQLTKHNPQLAARFASLTLAALAAVTGLITLLGEAILISLLTLLPESPDRALFFELTIIMLPYMPLVTAVAILGGILQVHKRFTPAAAAPVILNTAIIAAALLTLTTDNPRHTAYAISASVLIAGLAQLAWALIALRPHINWTRTFAGCREPFRRMRTQFLPALVSLGTLQLNAFIDTVIAMWPIWVGPTIFSLAYPLDTSSNAILFYTQRLYQFPLGVFGIAVATAIFPALARAADRPADFASLVRKGIRLSLFIALPASLGLALVRHDLIELLYHTGPTAFSAEGTSRAASVLLGYSVAIWAYSLNHVFTRSFFARADARTPMRVSLAMVVLNLTLNLTLIWPLSEAGLAWSTAITAITQTIIYAIITARHQHATLLESDTVRALLRIVLISIIMAASVGATLLLTQSLPVTPRLIAAVCAGITTYTLAALLTRAPELTWLLRRRA